MVPTTEGGRQADPAVPSLLPSVHGPRCCHPPTCHPPCLLLPAASFLFAPSPPFPTTAHQSLLLPREGPRGAGTQRAAEPGSGRAGRAISLAAQDGAELPRRGWEQSVSWALWQPFEQPNDHFPKIKGMVLWIPFSTGSPPRGCRRVGAVPHAENQTSRP